MSAVTELARAKVNLSLRVHGRRADGYHQLESLVVFADTGDRLHVSAANELTLDITGPFGSALEGEADNLVLRAARLLRDKTGIGAGAHLTLEKNLPVASGIGGGSADAAAALRGLARIWSLPPAAVDMAVLAALLGADVPVCLASCAALMSGVGETLAPLAALPDFWLVLANPGVAVPTASVFRELAAPPLATPPPSPVSPAWENFSAFIRWLDSNGNDLETPAMRLAPEIGETIAALGAAKGCKLARMSGSGATCFGIHEDEETAKEAAAALARAHPAWWVAVSRVR